MCRRWPSDLEFDGRGSREAVRRRSSGAGDRSARLPARSPRRSPPTPVRCSAGLGSCDATGLGPLDLPTAVGRTSSVFYSNRRGRSSSRRRFAKDWPPRRPLGVGSAGASRAPRPSIRCPDSLRRDHEREGVVGRGIASRTSKTPRSRGWPSSATRSPTARTSSRRSWRPSGTTSPKSSSLGVCAPRSSASTRSCRRRRSTTRSRKVLARRQPEPDREQPPLPSPARRRHRRRVHAPDGSIAGDKVWLVDFDDPEANDWLAVNQFTVIEGKTNRRPDVVVFVNGLPLGVIELKNPADEKATLQTAFNQLQTYKREIPSLFTTQRAAGRDRRPRGARTARSPPTGSASCRGARSTARRSPPRARWSWRC